jgi:hypothetical protein
MVHKKCQCKFAPVAHVEQRHDKVNMETVDIISDRHCAVYDHTDTQASVEAHWLIWRLM